MNDPPNPQPDGRDVTIEQLKQQHDSLVKDLSARVLDLERSGWWPPGAARAVENALDLENPADIVQAVRRIVVEQRKQIAKLVAEKRAS